MYCYLSTDSGVDSMFSSPQLYPPPPPARTKGTVNPTDQGVLRQGAAMFSSGFGSMLSPQF